jgi:hypothetical protein
MQLVKFEGKHSCKPNFPESTKGETEKGKDAVSLSQRCTGV